MVTWTRKDQTALDELAQRRAEFMRVTREPLVCEVMQTFCTNLGEAELMTDEMIRRADTFRDLLAPFDSGVRCAKPETQ